jgi:flagellar biosynthesis protein FliR
VSLRIAFALVLSLAVAQGMPPNAVPAGTHWFSALVGELARGTPIALTAAITVWAGVLAGGVTDAALATGTTAPESARGLSFARWLGLPAAALFLELGGAARVAERLAAPALDGALTRAAYDVAAGIEIGVAIGIPVLVVALFVDVVLALSRRELHAFGDSALWGPARTLVVLLLTAALLERMLEALSGIVSPAS